MFTIMMSFFNQRVPYLCPLSNLVIPSKSHRGGQAEIHFCLSPPPLAMDKLYERLVSPAFLKQPV